MRILRDPDCLLAEGLATLRVQFQVPATFPEPVLAAAQVSAQRQPTQHADWTQRPFVTLDPAGSTDLDQAFAIEAAGSDWLLHYAIADVGWFVEPGGALDAEAWARGVTTYLPDGKAGLYPPVLAEGAASLLPDGPRPAVVFTVRVRPDGETVLDAVTRAVIRSRAKLAYETVRDADLPDGFMAIAERIELAEARRGAARVDPPEQQVERNGDGKYQLQFRPLLPSETRNAALSLACNLAVAKLLLEHQTGLFRVMAGPDPAAEARLRQTAKAFGLTWPDAAPLAQFAAVGSSSRTVNLAWALQRMLRRLLPLPLAEFAKAYDGPPTDPKVFEETQKKLQEELQKRAEEARKKLEANPPAGGAPANPAAK